MELASISVAGKFQEVGFLNGNSGENSLQANNYSFAFNRDYKDVGGTKNLTASAVDNVITITAKKGTFISSAYTGNVLIVGSGTIDNTPQVPDLELTAVLTGNGDCSTVEYSVTATGGTPSYILKNGFTILTSGWDGSAFLVDVNREVGRFTFSATDRD